MSFSTEKRNKILLDFLHYWKLDDKEWVKQRKADWKYLEENELSEYSKAEANRIKQYFMKGKYSQYMPEMFILTPFDSDQAMKIFFQSDMYSASERNQVVGRCFSLSKELFAGARWERVFNQMFVRAILGSTYHKIEETTPTGRVEVISSEPTYWNRSFINGAIKILSGSEKYLPIVEAVEYFITALPYANDPTNRVPKKFHQMLALVESVSQQADVSPIAKEFSDKLMARKQEIIDNWNINAHLDK